MFKKDRYALFRKILHTCDIVKSDNFNRVYCLFSSADGMWVWKVIFWKIIISDSSKFQLSSLLLVCSGIWVAWRREIFVYRFFQFLVYRREMGDENEKQEKFSSFFVHLLPNFCHFWWFFKSFTMSSAHSTLKNAKNLAKMKKSHVEKFLPARNWNWNFQQICLK